MAATTPRLGIDHPTVVPDDPDGDGPGADGTDATEPPDGTDAADGSGAR
ncbi:MAG: hypothetical protein ABEH40_05215 [Haloferacaceae archaeon]